MSYYLEKLLFELLEDKRIKDIEGTARSRYRMIYKNGFANNEYTMELFFQVNKGNTFKETITFTIIANTLDNKVKIIKGFNNQFKIFNRNKYKFTAKHIINEILKFKEQIELMAM